MRVLFTLTSREVEVLCLLASDYKVKEVAIQLHIAPRTADTHRQNILRQMKTRSIHAAIVRAHQFRIINIDQLKLRD